MYIVIANWTIMLWNALSRFQCSKQNKDEIDDDDDLYVSTTVYVLESLWSDYEFSWPRCILKKTVECSVFIFIDMNAKRRAYECFDFYTSLEFVLSKVSPTKCIHRQTG